MTDVNKVLLTGTLKDNVDVKGFGDSAISYFILRVEFDYKDEGLFRVGNNQFEIFCYGKKFMRQQERLLKDAKVLVEGKLTHYTTNDCSKPIKTVVRAINVYFL